jgi:hypothetical protein
MSARLDGKWSENADRLVPRGPVTWTDLPRLGGTGFVGPVHVATLRRVTGGFIARIAGWQWAVTPDSGTARFNAIPGDKITHTPSKLFPTRGAAKRACELVLAAPPTGKGGAA